MTFAISRRALLVGSGLLLATTLPGWAQDKPVLRFSAVFESGGAKLVHGSGGIVPLRAV